MTKAQLSTGPTPKNIIFCFDGTGNKPEDAIEKPPARGDYVVNLTNVAKLHLLLGGDFEKNAANSHYCSMPRQISLYYRGIGNTRSKIVNKFQFNFAPRFAIENVVNDAIQDLRDIVNPGDKVFVIGFSRGAATARIFCSTIAKEEGLSDVKVEFLLCFDTVASIGMPDFLNLSLPKSEVLLEDKKIAPNVVQALHCCSIGENVRPYQPTLMNEDDLVTEVWFAGAHKDIGGGYKDCALSDVTLQFALDEIARRNLGLQVLSAADVKLDEINNETDGVMIKEKDIAVLPDTLGTDHSRPIKSRFWQKYRRVGTIKADRIIKEALPVIHYSVAQRIRSSSVDPPFRPANLDVPHMLLTEDGTHREMHGLDDYFLPSLDYSITQKMEEVAAKDLLAGIFLLIIYVARISRCRSKFTAHGIDRRSLPVVYPAYIAPWIRS